ncbi:MAG: outer membrane lipoprotein-sorting protein [Myxococcota bacterium]|nr:outer membrane lipoprotein-sorting protein [Myxococcota bacterium]
MTTLSRSLVRAMAATVLAITPRIGTATTPAEILEGARQAQKVDRSIQIVRMTLVSRSGAERVREFELRVRRDGEVLKSWTRFRFPADVAGTQLVVVDNPDRVDEQLLYLPALKRVNRIAGRARSGSFMGSDFRFEDLELAGASEATASLVSEDPSTWVLDATPGQGSSYGRLRMHVARADYLPRRVEYFDKKGAPVKVLVVEEVIVDRGIAIPKLSVMQDLKRGTRTRMEVLSHRLDVPASEIPDETFTAAWMERAL